MEEMLNASGVKKEDRGLAVLVSMEVFGDLAKSSFG